MAAFKFGKRTRDRFKALDGVLFDLSCEESPASTFLSMVSAEVILCVYFCVTVPLFFVGLMRNI